VTSKVTSDVRAESGNPTTDGLVGDFDPAFGQQILNVAKAEGKAGVKPHGVLDARGREVTVTVADRHHPPTLPVAQIRSAPDS
jgi:hypothetical protein